MREDNKTREYGYECHRAEERHLQKVKHRGEKEEKDRVKVRSCEAQTVAKSHTDCTYSKLGSESG